MGLLNIFKNKNTNQNTNQKDDVDFVITKESTKINVGSNNALIEQYLKLEKNLEELKALIKSSDYNFKSVNVIFDEGHELWKQTAAIYNKIKNGENVEVKIYETTKQFELMNNRLLEAINTFNKYSKYRNNLTVIIVIGILILIVFMIIFFVVIYPKIQSAKTP
jgi:hypothetical protein